ADSLLGPYAGKNVVSLFEDSRRRIWMGFYTSGLLMYDPAARQIQYWLKKDGDTSGISNNSVISVTEDKAGVIWAGTNEGLNFLDAKTGHFERYRDNEKISAEIISSLLADNRNRLWMASGRGMYMIDSARKSVKSFGLKDDLPSVDFNTQSACRLRNGDFIYPTLTGFVYFNPLLYADASDTLNVYISSFKVFGRALNDTTGFESVHALRLRPEENFFSLEMTALNYANPQQSWYAYKLEPFDKDWIYTRERLVNYTNVPGGDYVFHYRASSDSDNWTGAEKTLLIHVGTVYYKTWWFRLLLLLLAAAVLYGLYRVRIRQQERLHVLQTKAQSLEKEKTQVMYESLKQQLNPHFLFNSLTSLSSLITTNPPNAKLFLDKMSKIYRYILKNRDSEVVPLAEEIKLAETYTQLQQTRFRKGLLVHMVVDEEYLHRKIAPVTIQNLVENAIKHNIIDEGAPLLIDIFVEDEYLVVRNNVQKKTFVETSNRQGLANMRSLYHYLSGRPVV
ncbi:MAG TPA: histidine kinase, partial [Chitinophagaceae bacterium]|nr:histidine kinase [Chitinophagaceae bacterium]